MTRQFGSSLLLLTLTGSFGIVPIAEAQQVGNLTVEVDDLRDQEGNVCLKLFSSGEGFPNTDENALQITCMSIAPASAIEPSASVETSIPSEAAESTDPVSPAAEPAPEPLDSPVSTFRYTFDTLPYGNYAVAIYHDRNGDERLNRGLFGMPEEGYGFSNDAPASFGPADFDDALFLLDSPDSAIQIKMRYP